MKRTPDKGFAPFQILRIPDAPTRGNLARQSPALQTVLQLHRSTSGVKTIALSVAGLLAMSGPSGRACLVRFCLPEPIADGLGRPARQAGARCCSCTDAAGPAFGPSDQGWPVEADLQSEACAAPENVTDRPEWSILRPARCAGFPMSGWTSHPARHARQAAGSACAGRRVRKARQAVVLPRCCKAAGFAGAPAPRSRLRVSPKDSAASRLRSRLCKKSGRLSSETPKPRRRKWGRSAITSSCSMCLRQSSTRFLTKGRYRTWRRQCWCHSGRKSRRAAYQETARTWH